MRTMTTGSGVQGMEFRGIRLQGSSGFIVITHLAADEDSCSPHHKTAHSIIT